jgi:hypothetical protein
VPSRVRTELPEKPALRVVEAGRAIAINDHHRLSSFVAQTGLVTPRQTFVR